MQGHPALPTIRVARPCNSSWELMEGDDRVRHCSNCDKDVYSSAGLSRAEILELITAREGVCMRVYRRADGTLVTGECGDARAASSVLTPQAAWRKAAWLVGLGLAGGAVLLLLASGLQKMRHQVLMGDIAEHDIDTVDSNL